MYRTLVKQNFKDLCNRLLHFKLTEHLPLKQYLEKVCVVSGFSSIRFGGLRFRCLVLNSSSGSISNLDAIFSQTTKVRLKSVRASFQNSGTLIEFSAEGEEVTTGLIPKFRNSDKILS